jgi:polar amino acid transport system substrate-binding protein
MLSFFLNRPGRASSPHLFVALVGSAVLCFLLLSACSTAVWPIVHVTPTAESVGITPPNDLLTPGVLTVGSYTNYPPQESIDGAGKGAVGFDIDLINAMAQRMKLKTKIVTVDFHSIIDNLVDRQFDVVISAVSITHELQQRVDFVPYFSGGESLMVEHGNPENIRTLDDLCGQKVGVQLNTLEQNDLSIASSSCQKSGKAAIDVLVAADQQDLLQLLLTRQVIATYQDSPVTDYFIKLHPNRFEIAGYVTNANLEGIAVRKGDSSMLHAMQAAFNAVEVDGTYHKLIMKWGLVNEEIPMVNCRCMYQKSIFA